MRAATCESTASRTLETLAAEEGGGVLEVGGKREGKSAALFGAPLLGVEEAAVANAPVLVPALAPGALTSSSTPSSSSSPPMRALAASSLRNTGTMRGRKMIARLLPMLRRIITVALRAAEWCLERESSPRVFSRAMRATVGP